MDLAPKPQILQGANQVLIVTPYRDLILDGLVAWWPLREGSGTTTADMSGNGLTGTLTNMESGDWISGPIGLGALSFGGTNEYVDASFPAITGYPFTICAWFKADAQSVHFGFSDNTDDDPLYLVGLVNGTQPRVATRDINGLPTIEYLLSSATVTNNTWVHICGVWGSDTSRVIYVSGVADGSSASETYTFDANRLSFGRLNRLTPTYYIASMADPRCYNRELSAGEIAAIAAGRG